MTEIEKIKARTFDKVNAFAKTIDAKGNKSYLFTVREIKDNTAEKKISGDGYAEWPCVYAILNDREETQYIGNVIRAPWIRLKNNHLNPKNGSYKKEIQDNWKVLILYAKIWRYTHETMERELTDWYIIDREIELPLVKNR